MSFPKSLPDYAWPKELMRPRKLIRRWIMALLFRIAYLAGWCVGIIDRNRNRVLAIRTDGLGDGLLFEPALASLAREMAPRKIHLWAPQLTCDLFAHCKSVHRSMVIPRGFKEGNLLFFGSSHWRIKLGYALGRWKFDRVIYPVQSPEPFGNWLLASARAGDKWITRGDQINQFDWQQQRTHEEATRVLNPRAGKGHELTFNEFLARQWTRDRKLRKPKVHLTERLEESAKSLADQWRAEAQQLGGKEIVAVIPAASMRLNSYPDELWVTAIKQLWESHRTVAVLLGGPGDSHTLDCLQRMLLVQGVPSLRLANAKGILEMTALIGELDGVVSVDTGLAHLAVAQNVPTVVLAGGGYPGRFFPWPNSPRHITLTQSVPCIGCHNRCTQSEPVCITQISPERIVNAFNTLKRRRTMVEVTINQKPADLKIAI
ncbi:MAG TPA: glycosyltransferase family 9 protein [Tepidisphaeraceae bacterium]|nr:glycosyltransferase family 9 protein [Tepidisphaeraceae bacterium]